MFGECPTSQINFLEEDAAAVAQPEGGLILSLP
jgi:hypothetical protein